MNRRTIGSWCLYDFGNSAFAVLIPAIYAVYYAGTVVGNETGAGDAWWGRTVSLSMLLVALSSPFLGGIADHAGIRKRMLALYTGVGIAAVLAITQVEPGMVIVGFLVGVFATVGFEGGIVFYNAYLPDIAPPSHHGRVSAQGFAVGYAGSLVALGIAVILIKAELFGWVWVALAVQWFLFALPAFRHLPPDRRTGVGVGAAAARGLRQTMQTLRDVMKMKDLRRFLAAYFFYTDGVNTVIIFASVYANKTLEFSSVELIYLIGLVQISALLGSLAMAKPTDLKGPRWAVLRILGWWILVLAGAFFAQTKTVFWIVAALAGLGLGSIQAASRALMARLVPKGREAEMFGFYALCGKTGAILGPLVFAEISRSVGNQRYAILSVAVFFVVGFLLLRGVQVPEPEERATEAAPATD